jgi:hypothetical protein
MNAYGRARWAGSHAGRPGAQIRAHVALHGDLRALLGGLAQQAPQKSATLRYLDAAKLEENLSVLRPYIFREI